MLFSFFTPAFPYNFIISFLNDFFKFSLTKNTYIVKYPFTIQALCCMIYLTILWGDRFMVFEQLLVLYIFIFLGWLFGRLNPQNTSGSKIISFLLVNLFLPSKVFLSFSKSFTVAYLKENYATFFISTAILLMLALLAIPLSALLSKKRYERKVYRYSFAITNYAYMGYVLIDNVLGKSALANMITFCIPFAIYTYTFGYSMLTGEGKVIKKLINPMTVAILLGCTFGLVGIPMPSVLDTALNTASSCVGALSMLLTGLMLASFSSKELLPDKGTLAFVGLRLVALLR